MDASKMIGDFAFVFDGGNTFAWFKFNDAR
jgi:hypothetical protein